MGVKPANMAKSRKIKRTTNLYKRRSVNKNAVSIVVFILIVGVFIFGGYIVGKEWNKRFGPNKQTPPSSISLPSSTSPPTSSDNKTSSDDATSSDSGVKPVFEAKFSKAISMPFDAYVGKSDAQIAQFISGAKANGYDAVAVELKDEDGTIYYKSQNPMASEYSAVDKNAVDIDRIVAPIKAAGLVPIAQISALKDRTAPSVVRKNGYAYDDNFEINWWDNSAANGGKPWLNPYMDNTRKYVSELSKEAQTAGFEIISLTNVIFPDKNTNLMNVITETMSREDILKKVVTDVQEACDVPVMLCYKLAFSDTAGADIRLAKSSSQIAVPHIKASELETLAPILLEQAIDKYIIY